MEENIVLWTWVFAIVFVLFVVGVSMIIGAQQAEVNEKKEQVEMKNTAYNNVKNKTNAEK